MRRNIKILIYFILIVVSLFFLYNLILLGEIVEDVDPFAVKKRENTYTQSVDHHDDEPTPNLDPLPPKPVENEKPPETKPKPRKQPTGPLPNLSQYNTSLLILTYKRDKYLKRVLKSLKELPHLNRLTNIIISQDGHNSKVKQVVDEFEATSVIPTIHIHHQQNSGGNSVKAIANHYGWALGQAFEKVNSDFVIILEDDILPSYDFLEYFDQLSPFLLDPNEKVWCVSSWNDLGFKHFDLDPTKVFRTHFFPGLGWMMHRKVWMEEFRLTWPNQAWDYYMRTSHIHRHRDCICPYLPRNTNIGVEGSTVKGANTFERLLSRIGFQSEQKTFDLDLSTISLRVYDNNIIQMISRGKVLPLNTRMDSTLLEQNKNEEIIVIPYEYRSGLQGILRSLSITYHNEERTNHEHVMIIRYRENLKIVLVNAKVSKFAPSSIRIDPPKTFEAVSAESNGVSCDKACASHGKRCSEGLFDYVMNCDMLKRFFPCERGCMVEIGREIPCYVTAKNDLNYQKCIMVWQDHPKCMATHRNTIRLCPCE